MIAMIVLLKALHHDVCRYATFSVIYLLSGVAGSTASFLFNNLVTVGASGAIFGLLGACALQVADLSCKLCLRRLQCGLPLLAAVNYSTTSRVKQCEVLRASGGC